MVEGCEGEVEKCWESAHVARVWAAFAGEFPRWAERYAAEAVVGGTRFAKRGGHRGAAIAAPPAEWPARLAALSAQAAADYARQRAPYDALLDAESLEEYAREPREFAREAVSKLPVLNNALYSAIDEMTVWKRRFGGMLKARPSLFLQLMSGVVEFADAYPSGWAPGKFAGVTDPAALGVECLDPLRGVQDAGEEWRGEPESGGGGVATVGLSIPGLVGAGITSAIGHYRAPGHLAPRNRHALAAMYFLAGRDFIGLESSEFLLWSTRTGSQGHNFAYPYPLFLIHALEVSRLMERFHARLGVAYDARHRMALVSDFFFFVARAKEHEISTWRSSGDL